MAFEALHAPGFRTGEELLLPRCIPQPERNVHQRPILSGGHSRLINVGMFIQYTVYNRSLFTIPRLDRRQPTLSLDPLQHQANDVNSEGRRRVVERVRLGVGLVAEDRAYLAACFFEK